MNIVERVKNIIVSPKLEWEKIDAENLDMKTVIMSYVLPLAVISAICAFIGYGFIGLNAGYFRMKGMNWGIYYGVMALVSPLITIVVSTYIVDMLAPSFASEKNLNKSANLVAFSMTPALIGGFLSILPMIAIIGSLFAIYGLYLWYLGLGPIKQTPEDKKVVYIVVTALIAIVVYFIIGMIFSRLLMPIFGVGLPTITI